MYYFSHIPSNWVKIWLPINKTSKKKEEKKKKEKNKKNKCKKQKKKK